MVYLAVVDPFFGFNLGEQRSLGRLRHALGFGLRLRRARGLRLGLRLRRARGVRLGRLAVARGALSW